MKTHLKILTIFIVLTSILVKSGDVFEGAVGEKVEIRCPYPDNYKYTPKYFCKHPCRSSGHVLIGSEGAEEYSKKGRYSLIDSNGDFFTVIISGLSLKDSGVYYCGLNQWFQDSLNKVHLSVRLAPVVRPSHTSEITIIITTTSTWTTTLTSAGVTFNNSTSYEQSSPTGQSKGSNGLLFFSMPVVIASFLVLLVFGVIVALVFLGSKISHSKSRCLNHAVPENSVQVSPDLNQTVDDVFHIYNEMVSTYSLAGPARNADSSDIYSTVQHCDPAPQENVNDFYSLITHH
ncbi:CMRF35-like molecule 1 isoform X2 [Pseudorasbora parva]|uniref:CMRF35-like molecule 1 isoform X2 n=1 Tax=Pseudorasbora parva TaxID=51549 RepID=UPI00351F3E8F